MNLSVFSSLNRQGAGESGTADVPFQQTIPDRISCHVQAR